MSQWSEFLSKVESGAVAAATGDLKTYLTQVKADTTAFLTQCKTDLQTWTTQLAAGQITADDLQANVGADIDLAKMAALTDAGIGLAAVQKFRDTLVQVVVSAATDVFLH